MVGMSAEIRYRYEYADGSHAYDVIRTPGKDFRQVPASGKTGPGAMEGVELVPYRLPEIVRAVARGETVWIVEGEKDADTLRDLDETATTSPGGAGNWRPEYAQYVKGAKVVLCPDRDAAGAKYALEVYGSLVGIADSVEICHAAVGKDVTDHIDARQPLADLVPVELAELVEWEPLVPLGSVRDLPQWPRGCLPSVAEEYVLALSEQNRTDPRLAATIALGVLAGASAGLAKVAPDSRHWREPLNLWVLPVAVTGSQKGAIYSEVVRPLERAEADLVNGSEHERLTALAQERAAQSRQAKAEKDLGNAKTEQARQEATAELDAAIADVRRERDTSKPQLLSADLTVQTLPDLLARNRGRLIVASSESGLFETLAGRYAKGREDISVILSGHSGDRLKVDRLGREGSEVGDPALTMILSVQPARLQHLGQIAGSYELGLMGRFLFSLTESQRGRRSFRNAPIVAERLRGRWHELVRTIAETPVPEQTPIVRLSDQAADRFWHWLDHELEPRLGPSGDLGSEQFAGWSAKYAGAVLRIAGVLHVADQVAAGVSPSQLGQIPLATLERALRLGSYFEVHALAAHELAGIGHAQGLALRIVAHAERNDWQPISTRDLHQGLKGGDSDLRAEDVAEALAELAERGYVHKVARKGKTRRPSPLCLWNPALSTPRAPQAVNVGDLGEGFEDSGPTSEELVQWDRDSTPEPVAEVWA